MEKIKLTGRPVTTQRKKELSRLAKVITSRASSAFEVARSQEQPTEAKA